MNFIQSSILSFSIVHIYDMLQYSKENVILSSSARSILFHDNIQKVGTCDSNAAGLLVNVGASEDLF